MSAGDLVLLQAIARYRALTYAQCGRVLNISESAAGRRARDLIQLGILEKSTFRLNGVLWVGLTRTGLEALGLPPRRQPWSLATIQHTWWIAEIGLDLEAEHMAPLTDRELAAYAANTRSRTRDVVAIRTPGGQHIPDLRVFTDAGELAIEVQLTRKARGDFERILRAYKDDPGITAVQYWAATTSLAHHIENAVRAVRATDLVTVCIFDRPTPWTPTTATNEDRLDALVRHREALALRRADDFAARANQPAPKVAGLPASSRHRNDGMNERMGHGATGALRQMR